MPTPAAPTKRLIILGCTGSIGTQTIRVLEGLARAGGWVGGPVGGWRTSMVRARAILAFGVLIVNHGRYGG